MQYTGIAAYPRRVSEQPISFYELNKIECFGIKGLFIVFFTLYLFNQLVNKINEAQSNKQRKSIAEIILIIEGVD